MKCVILDKGSLDRADIDYSSLEKQCDHLTFFENTSPEQLHQRCRDAEVIISNKVMINAEVINQCEHLKLICVAATGTNNIDIDAATHQGIPVCNVSGYATSSVSQHVFALILMLSRNLHQYLNAITKQQWQTADHFCLLDYPIIDLSAKTLGIIGYGELGKAVAKLGESFGMKVLIGESLTERKDPNRTPLEQLVQQSDVLSLHCPLTPQTQNLIQQDTFRQMKHTALLINTARGGIVNETDLWHALHQGQIAGAAMDVLTEEPPKNGNILLDKPLPNLLITPHIAWASQKCRQQLVNEIALNIEAFKQGTERNIVNSRH